MNCQLPESFRKNKQNGYPGPHCPLCGDIMPYPGPCQSCRIKIGAPDPFPCTCEDDGPGSCKAPNFASEHNCICEEDEENSYCRSDIHCY